MRTLTARITTLPHITRSHSRSALTFAATAVVCCLCWFSGSLPVISLGSRSLLSLHSVFAMESHQVGLANIGGSSGGSNASCVSDVRCVGQQTLDSTYNVCVDPSCSSYYFFSLNSHTRHCELTVGFHVLAALLIAALVLSELGLTEWLIRVSRRVQGIANEKQNHSAQQARRRRRAAAAH